MVNASNKRKSKKSASPGGWDAFVLWISRQRNKMRLSSDGQPKKTSEFETLTDGRQKG